MIWVRILLDESAHLPVFGKGSVAGTRCIGMMSKNPLIAFQGCSFREFILSDYNVCRDRAYL